jgi:hypothetical protein
MTLVWRSVSMSMRELHESLGETKNYCRELLVALGNIVRAFFMWFFKLHQNSLLLLVRW